DRVLTRVVQGAGRCTRSATDYACVIVLGQDLTKFFLQPENRSLLHPELQAEIAFGLKQSQETAEAELLENLRHFIDQDDEWAGAEQQIVSVRSTMTARQVPAADLLKAAVAHEVRYQYAVWHGNYENALDESRSVLTHLTGNEIKGYRAFWYYLAGSAAALAAGESVAGMEQVARENYRHAVAALPAVKWLVKLCRAQSQTASPDVRDPL